MLSTTPYELDESSLIVKGPNGDRYRLPIGKGDYTSSWELGFPRALREVQSERYLANLGGTFYEVPRSEGAGNHVPDYQKIKPISTHDKRIVDYCSWRGLLVLSGIDLPVNPHANLFTNGEEGLWMGKVDDLWKLGKPRGKGGPWFNSEVSPQVSSDPYLMTGYDQKMLEISHDQSEAVEFNVEIAIAHGVWVPYQDFSVKPGVPLKHSFPEGYQAHWVRFTVDQACKATALLTYF